MLTSENWEEDDFKLQDYCYHRDTREQLINNDILVAKKEGYSITMTFYKCLKDPENFLLPENYWTKQTAQKLF